MGMGGPTGLRYEAAYPLIERATETEEDWMDLFEDLRTLERAALKQMRDDSAD